jgi:hypothetical protein
MLTHTSSEEVYFQVEPDPAVLRAISELEPENALLTPAYAEFRSRQGDTPVAILAHADGERVGFTAFIVPAGRYHRLDIESVPDVAAEHPIWQEILAFCSSRRVIRIRVDSFGSTGATIPALGREVYRRARLEYVLDLHDGVSPAGFSTNHRRNLRRAQDSGIEVAEYADPASIEGHTALIDLSKERRRERGENIYRGMSIQGFRDIIETRAGILFQAGKPGEATLSSLLVLLSERGAYYHSAGTSPDGMSLGASQFLVASVAERLGLRGVLKFNLGGASDDQPGLARFKAGFGTRINELEAACFDNVTGLSRLWVSIGSRLPMDVLKVKR